VSWFGKGLDKIIGEISPSAGMRRTQARNAMSLMMNYDGASKGRRTYGWKAPSTDADAAAYGVRAPLRQLSREFLRNRPYAVRAQSVVTSNVVGTGVVPAVKHDNPEVQRGIADAVLGHLLSPWLDALGELNLYAMQEVVMNTVFADGEVLARRRLRTGRYAQGLRLGFQIELLEVDHLDTTITSNGKNEVCEGIEYSPIGDVEAYHVFPRHPGNARLLGDRVRSERVSWADIIHVRRFDRPGQLRGVPWLAPVMLAMGELSDYQEAQILKQKMAALMAAIVAYDKDSMPGDPADRLKGLSELEPGAIIGVPDGAEVSFTQPPKVDAYSEFMREGLGAIAMGIGITRESLTGDLSGVNFSSGRMGRMEMDRNVERWQQLLMIGQFCAGVERWVREAFPMTRIHPGEAFAMTWTAPRRPLIDPNDEVDAMLKQVAGGLNSRQSVQRTLGLDPDRVRRERAEDRQQDETLQLDEPVAVDTPTARVSRAEKQAKQVETGQ
jgi:lambda family phage portal protein